MSTSNEKHIMLSYAWQGGHRKVDQIARDFRAAGIPVWMDTRNGLGEDVIDGMAEAVENSLAVCYFLTPEYQESKYCEKELKYAHELDKPIIPCFLTDFKPRKWLGFLTAGLIRYDFSDEVNGTILKPLICYIKRDILKVKARTNPKPVKTISQPVPSEERYVNKTATGTADSDEEQSTSDCESSSDVSGTNTPATSSGPTAKNPFTSHIRFDISKLTVNQTRRRPGIHGAQFNTAPPRGRD